MKVETFRFFFQLERESKSGAKLKAYEGIFLFFVLCVWIYGKGYGGVRDLREVPLVLMGFGLGCWALYNFVVRV